MLHPNAFSLASLEVPDFFVCNLKKNLRNFMGMFGNFDVFTFEKSADSKKY